MELTISFKQMDPNDTVKHYIEEKTQRLKKYFDGRLIVTWTISRDNHVEKVAHCHLVGNHMNYFGEDQSKEIYEAIDSVIDKIERQIREKKNRIKNHHVTAEQLEERRSRQTS